MQDTNSRLLMDIIAPPIAGEDFLGELSLYAGIHPSIRSWGGRGRKKSGASSAVGDIVLEVEVRRIFFPSSSPQTSISLTIISGVL